MRVANVRGRLSLLTDEGAVDVAAASAGRFGPDPQSVWSDWGRFVDWAAALGPQPAAAYAPENLRPPVPRPGQIFAIGLNYWDNAEEAELDLPDHPVTFTKFPSCITGPWTTLALPSDRVDWEVELVVVVGREAHRIDAARAWSVVAGVTVGQDLSERDVQHRPPAPQFCLGKSFPGFGPIGPAVVTIDELPDPDDLELGCRINGEELQRGRTSSMIFTVPELVGRLSEIVTLRPGDLIFTGTPAGVGAVRTPPRYLRPGDVLESYVTGVGEMRHPLVGNGRNGRNGRR
ncbi:MAG TPA: fumarylacetoacetate hydrolase family protein [Candidatus Dormibacteraeota bacterium]|jgi:2-keto-4-pentenoate hydratase/2-oxohepta-3-ene-1,7-dioic acid hydratase in catechol pathway